MGSIEFDFNNSGHKKYYVKSHGWFRLLFASKRRLLYFTVFVSFVTTAIVLIICGLYMYVKSLYPDKPTYINDKGAMVFSVQDKEVYLFLFNSSQMFANSGIRVQKGDRIKISCSGRYNSAINLLTQAAQTDIKPAYEWRDIDGKGKEDKKKDTTDNRYMAISPRDNFGTVLVCTFPEGKDPLRKYDNNYLYKDSSLVCSVSTFANKYRRIKVEGVLTFIINDIPIIDTMMLDSLIPKSNEKLRRAGYQTDSLELLKRNFIESGYNAAFFDDNLGEFLMVVEKRGRWIPSTIFHWCFAILCILGVGPFLVKKLSPIASKWFSFGSKRQVTRRKT